MSYSLIGLQLDTLEGQVYPPGITSLNVSHNRLTQLSNLPAELIHLYCDHNRLTSIPRLPDTLQLLDVSHNQLTELSNLPASLKILDFGNNQIHCLTGLPQLILLSCRNNLITRLTGLPDTIEYVICNGNRISSADDLLVDLRKHYYKVWFENYPLVIRYYDNPMPDKYRAWGTSSLLLVDRGERVWKARSILMRLLSQRAAFNIQRVWRNYWLKPYFDPDRNHWVSRYMLAHRDELS